MMQQEAPRVQHFEEMLKSRELNQQQGIERLQAVDIYVTSI
jgi:hypothetical protein